MAGTGADDTGHQSSRSEAKPSLAAPKVKERKDRLNPVNQSFISDIFCTFALPFRGIKHGRRTGFRQAVDRVFAS